MHRKTAAISFFALTAGLFLHLACTSGTLINPPVPARPVVPYTPVVCRNASLTPCTPSPTVTPNLTGTPTSTPTSTPTATRTPTKTSTPNMPRPTPNCAGSTLIGSTNISGDVNVLGGRVYFIGQGAGYGEISEIHINFAAAGTTVVVGIYSDIYAGAPISLLASSNPITTTSGWNTIPLISSLDTRGMGNLWFAVYLEGDNIIRGGSTTWGYLELAAGALPLSYPGGGTPRTGWLAINADVCPSTRPTLTPVRTRTPTPSPTVNLTATATLTPVPTPCSNNDFFGYDVQTANVSFSPFVTYAQPATLTQPATVIQITSRLSTAHTCRFGIYSDNAGQPGTLLVATNLTSLQASYRAVPVPPLVLAPGVYWLATYSTDSPGFWGNVFTGITCYSSSEEMPTTFSISGTYPAVAVLWVDYCY